MRRLWCGLILAVGAGAAAAQPPRPATPDVILVAKTAGQPERKLKLLKLFTGTDGERLAEVQDVASGSRYQLPASALSGMARSSAEPAPPAKQPIAPGGKFPTSLPIPEPSAGGQSPFVSRPLPTAAPPRPMSAAPVALDTPLTAMAGNRPAPPAAVLSTPAPTRAAEPPRPMPAVAPPAPALPIQPVADPPTPVVLAARPPLAPVVPLEPARPPVAEPPPVVAVPPPSVRPVTHQLAAVPPARPVWEMTRAEQMRAEIDPYTHDLAHALRPSVRERAAQALANCRHASQPEVKQLLAQVARTDPAPTVQARCVAILSGLGYHAREYVEFLEESAGSPHAGLRQAAVAALGRLAPR